jgi:hypothetical protein
MTYRPSNPGSVGAFVKRRSSVQARLAALAFSKDLHDRPSPDGPLSGVEKGASGTKPVHGPKHSGVRPAWLLEAREHVRRHYPACGLTESLLWTLAAIGFDPDRGSR